MSAILAQCGSKGASSESSIKAKEIQVKAANGFCATGGRHVGNLFQRNHFYKDSIIASLHSQLPSRYILEYQPLSDKTWAEGT